MDETTLLVKHNIIQINIIEKSTTIMMTLMTMRRIMEEGVTEVLR